MRAVFPLVLAAVLGACGGKTDSDPAGTGSLVGAPTGTTGGGTLSGTTSVQMPADPRPVELVFGGGLSETITFDMPTCSNYPFPSLVNFRTFWRGSDHNAVLIAEVLTDFAGAGTYETGTHNLRVKLQTEAGTVYDFELQQVDTAQGDTASMEVEHVDEVAFGSFTVSGLTGPGGPVTVSPATIPIWCETVEN